MRLSWGCDNIEKTRRGNFLLEQPDDIELDLGLGLRQGISKYLAYHSEIDCGKIFCSLYFLSDVP